MGTVPAASVTAGIANPVAEVIFCAIASAARSVGTAPTEPPDHSHRPRPGPDRVGIDQTVRQQRSPLPRQGASPTILAGRWPAGHCDITEPPRRSTATAGGYDHDYACPRFVPGALVAMEPMSRGGAVGSSRALTTLVGRGEEIGALVGLLSTHRLVTVIGPGGVGKTRLAAEITHRYSGRDLDRAVLVELAAVSEPELVPATVAAALGVQQRTDRTLTQALIDVLERGRALLVLDNCEHLVGAVAQLCGTLLASSEDIRILTTSREPLRVPGEARLRLRPLAVERPDGSPADADALALFVDRVRLVDPRFEMTAESMRLARQIVTRLDGLPLAIELAAARYESLGLGQLLRRLDEPLGVLAGGARTGPRRHRSLRETVDWSYRLLREPHREAFRRLAVFPVPFALSAALAVGAQEPALLDLVDYSLLVPPARGPDHTERYAMLQGVRAFALERLLDADEQPGVERAMFDYYLAAAERCARSIHTAEREARAAAWFDAEDASVHQALSWALRHDRTGAMRLATALAGWWQLRGRAVAGYRQLRQATDGPGDHDRTWVAAQLWLGRLAQSTARWQLALSHFTAVCDTLGSDAPSSALVDGLAGRSGTLRNLIRLTEAADVARQALRLARHLGYSEGEAFALTQLSLAADYAGDRDAAMRYAVQAAHVDRSGLPDRLARRIALVLTIVHTDFGDLESARQSCAEGLRTARAAGDINGQADFLHCATRIAIRTGAFADAGAHIRESLRLTDLSGDRLRLLGCLDECAQICAATGRIEDALTLWAAGVAQAAALDVPGLPRDLRRAADIAGSAARHLGAQRIDQAERRGAAMTLQTATEFAALLASSETGSASGAPGAALTPRERELTALVARGRTDAQIAAELFISIRTVRSHLDRIRDKTGSRRRADLTRLALREGLA